MARGRTDTGRRCMSIASAPAIASTPPSAAGSAHRGMRQAHIGLDDSIFQADVSIRTFPRGGTVPEPVFFSALTSSQAKGMRERGPQTAIREASHAGKKAGDPTAFDDARMANTIVR